MRPLSAAPGGIRVRGSALPQTHGPEELGRPCNGNSPVAVSGVVAATCLLSLQGSGLFVKPPFPATGWDVVGFFCLDCGWFSVTLSVLRYTSSAKHSNVQLSRQ